MSDRDSKAPATVPPEVSPVPSWIAAMADGSHEVVCLHRADGQPWYVSPAVERVFGDEPDVFLSADMMERVHPGDRERVRASFAEVYANAGARNSFSYRIEHAFGGYVHVESTATNCLDEDSLQSVVVFTRDLSEQTGFDRATGLPDRAAFLDAVARALNAAEAPTKRSFAVLGLDVDRFKMVAGSLDPLATSALLSEIGGRLERWKRPGDTVARIRDAVFALLLPDVPDASAAQTFADRTQQVFDEPFRIHGQSIAISVSVGIASSERAYEYADDVLRDAEVASTRAKERGHGRNRKAVFHTQMRMEGMQFLGIQADLVGAVDRGELRVFYQPILSLKQRAIVGFEALMRWMHPQRGLVAPASFISIAEDTGLIVPIGAWILHESCRQVAAWQSKFRFADPLYVSVNISPRQFTDDDLVPTVQRALEHAGIEPCQLKLEVTESVGLENRALAETKFRNLKALGVGMSLDDFGTGYSSFSNLHQFPYDTLKIDRSFVSMLDDKSRPSTEIIHAIVLLAHNLHMEVVAEGVETTTQLEPLVAMECERAQGYLFAKPLPGPDAEAFLSKSPRW